MRLRDVPVVASLVVTGCEESGVGSVVDSCRKGTLSSPARAAVPLDVFVVNNPDGMNARGCSVYETVNTVRVFMSESAGIDLVPNFTHVDFDGSASYFLRRLMLPVQRQALSQLTIVYGFDLGQFEKHHDPWGLAFDDEGVAFLDLDPPRDPNSSEPCIGLDVILAHELGHLLGLEHHDGERNLMYEVSEYFNLEVDQANLMRCVAGHYFGLPIEDDGAN